MIDRYNVKLFLFLFSILIFANEVAAQRPAGAGRGQWGGGRPSSIKGKVMGILLDSATNEALPYVTLLLRNPKTKKDINGGLSDDTGAFKIINVPIGTYDLLISSVGYGLITKRIVMTPKKPDIDLGNVMMQSTTQELDEVTVVGEKQLVESKIDKLVYNAERDVANAGGDATDVLRRAPLLSVDLDGNVSLRGSSNIQILINGKPSSILASSPADILQAIPADQIKSVEVITSPSAKYDGEGSAGIVNIITKRKRAEGFAGNVNMSVGTRQNNAVVGINAGRGRFGFNANASSYYSWPQTRLSEFLREDQVGNGETRVLFEDGAALGNRLGFFGSAGAYYDFNAYHSLTSSFRLRGFQSNSNGTFDTDFTDPSQGLFQQYVRKNDNTRLVTGYEWSLDYIIKFPEQKDRELVIAYKIDGDIQDQENIITQEDAIGDDLSLFRDERNFNDGRNREDTWQIDYVHPMGKWLKVETGAKAVLRNVTSDFEYDFLDVETQEYVVDPQQTDNFIYDQDVMAGYVSGNFKLGKKYGLIAGVRYERTEIRGDLTEQEITFANDYNNWLPNIIISRKLGKMNSIKASFNRRIQRPNLRFINPFVQVANNRNISFGNPELDPELTDQYELSYNTFVKGVSLNLSTYYRRTTDVIESFLEVNDEGVSVTTFRNIGENNSIGVNIFTSFTLFKIWTLRGGINGFSYDASGIVDGQRLSNTAILFNGNINSNLKLNNGWIIDMFGFLRGRRQTLQGFNPSFSIFSMGIRKDIWDKKGSIGLRIVEPFFARKQFNSELSGPNYFQRNDRAVPFQSFGINFRYKFGKLDFKQRERRSRIRNNDQKQGGGEEGGGRF